MTKCYVDACTDGDAGDTNSGLPFPGPPLKPCPFCGGDPTWVTSYEYLWFKKSGPREDWYCVECANLKCCICVNGKTRPFKTKREAAEMWNKRYEGK
jgi:hypothetical protein